MTQGAMLEIGADAVSSSIKPNFQGGRAFLLTLWCLEHDSACSHHTAFKDCPHTELPVFQLERSCRRLFLTLVVFWCRWLVRTDVQCFSGMAEQLPKRKKKISLAVNHWPHCEIHQTLRKQLKLFALVENGKGKSTGNCLLFCFRYHRYNYSPVRWDSFTRKAFQLKHKETSQVLFILFVLKNQKKHKKLCFCWSIKTILTHSRRGCTPLKMRICKAQLNSLLWQLHLTDISKWEVN